MQGTARAAFAATAVLAACLWGASPAPASPQQQSIFMDDDLLLYRGPERAAATLRELRNLGVDMVRVSVPWRAIAPDHRALVRPRSLRDPTDPDQYPAARWDQWDTVVREARHFGINVLLNVTGGAPIWATGTLHGRHVSLQYLPDPKQFEQFVAALGRRYSGRWQDENQGRHELPLVRDWSIWNEPNQGALLQPQWRTDPGDPLGRKIPYSPHWYRRLFRAAQSALFRTGHSADVILIGETAPLGNSRPGIKRHIRPLLFLRELFCMGADLQPLQGREAEVRGCDYAGSGPLFATGYAHHPYSVISPPQAPGPDHDDAKLGDTPKLQALLDRAGALARIPTNLPIWYTEYGYQTLPPDPIRGIALDQQSQWLAEAEKLTWANPRVYALDQFLMLDALPRSAAPAGSRRYWGTFQSGLRFADGRAKPAYFSYRLPLVVTPAVVAPGGTLELWGMVRPGDNGYGQTVLIEFRPEGATGFSAVGGPISVDEPHGYFTITRAAAGSGDWRFSWLDPGTGSWIPSPARRVTVS